MVLIYAKIVDDLESKKTPIVAYGASSTARINDKTYFKSCMLTVQGVKPNIEILSPENNSFNSGNVSIIVAVDDDVAIDSAILYLDDQEKASWSSAGTYTYYWYTPDYLEGPHNVTVWARDVDGYESKKYYVLWVDNTAPNVIVTEPVNREYLNHSDVTIVWNASDNFGIDHYEVRLDGNQRINVGNKTQYTFNDVPDGDHYAIIYAFDLAGNVGSDVVYFTVDTKPPEIGIILPSNGSWLNTPNITVEWIADDDESGVKYFEVRCYNSTWNSGLINVGSNTSYTFYGLSTGRYIVEVIAYDNAGNSRNTTISFGVDLKAPILYVLYPKNGSYVNCRSPILEWIGDDLESGIDHYEIRLINSTWDSGWINTGKEAKYVFYHLSEDMYFFYVRGFDVAGNIRVTRVVFGVDVTKPTLEVYNIENNSVVCGDMEIELYSYDEHPNSTWIEINGTEVVYWSGTGSFRYIWNTSTYTDGPWIVRICARDLAGNTVIYRFLVYVDNTEPILMIFYPGDGDIVFGVVNVTMFVDDEHLELAYLMINGSTVEAWDTCGNHTYLWNTSNISDGLYELTLYAEDAVGHVSEVSIVVIVDNNPPTVYIIYPQNNSLVYVTFTLKWNITDYGSGLYIVEVYLNQSLVATYMDGINMTNMCRFVGLSPGSYVLTIIAMDHINRTAEIRIIVHVTILQVTILSPSNNTALNNTSISVEWIYAGNISRFILYANDTLVAELPANSSRYTLRLDEGLWNITVVAVSIDNRSSVSFIIIYIDLTPPTINILSPKESEVLANRSIIVSWEIHDNFGIQKTLIRIDSQEWIDVSGKTKYIFLNVSPGEHTIEILAIDRAGNSARSTTSFIVIEQAPATTLIVTTTMVSVAPTSRLLPMTLIAILVLLSTAASLLAYKYWRKYRQLQAMEGLEQPSNSS